MSEVGHLFVIGKPNTKGKSSITYKFNLKGKRFVYGTGQIIYPELWSKDNQRPTLNKKLISQFEKDNPQIRTEIKNINQRLENITSATLTFFSLKEQQKAAVVFKELKDYLNSEFNPRNQKIENKKKPNPNIPSAPMIRDLINNFIRSISNGTKLIQMPITKRGQKYDDASVKAYIGFQKMFLEFEECENEIFKVTDISKDFEDSLLGFFNEEKDYTPNTKGKHIKMLKAIIHEFIESEWKTIYENSKNENENSLTPNDLHYIERELKRIIKPNFEPTRVALDETELNLLFNLDLSDIPHLERARDIFLCGCYTALRHSDYSRIGPEHIKLDVLEIITVKGKRKIRIPIRPEFNSILEKYEFKIPQMTSQELGRYIKEIGRLAGINEHIEVKESRGGKIIDTIRFKYDMITTHTARRSAASIMHYSGMPIKDIMAITGHSKIETFEKYIVKDEKEQEKRHKSSPFFIGHHNLKIVR